MIYRNKNTGQPDKYNTHYVRGDNATIQPLEEIMAQANDTSIKKEFTQEQIQILLQAIDLIVKSMERRAASETDPELKNIWNSKKDKAQILASKLRLT